MEKIAGRNVAVDTQVFIYYMEESERYFHIVDGLFEAIGSGKISAFTSVITLIEVLAKPLKEGRHDLVSDYKKFLSRSSHLNMYWIDDRVAEQAALFRAKYNLKVPDAIQAALAFTQDIKTFVCNDMDLKRVGELEVIVLDDFLST